MQGRIVTAMHCGACVHARARSNSVLAKIDGGAAHKQRHVVVREGRLKLG
jgi:hypothetical protein